MVFKPNYNFQKAERLKAKQSRKEEKAREKEQRKLESGTASEPAAGSEMDGSGKQASEA